MSARKTHENDGRKLPAKLAATAMGAMPIHIRCLLFFWKTSCAPCARALLRGDDTRPRTLAIPWRRFSQSTPWRLSRSSSFQPPPTRQSPLLRLFPPLHLLPHSPPRPFSRLRLQTGPSPLHLLRLFSPLSQQKTDPSHAPSPSASYRLWICSSHRLLSINRSRLLPSSS